MNRKEYYKKWYETHRNEMLAHQKKYHETHKNEILAHKKQYYKEHRNERLAPMRQYYKEHRDEILAYQKRYNETHRDEMLTYGRQWREQNKEKYKQQVKAWQKNHKKQWHEIRRKGNFKRRKLGFVCLNEPFENSEAHHICATFVIYIPKDMHRSISHNVWTGKNMDEINKLAFDYLIETKGLRS